MRRDQRRPRATTLRFDDADRAELRRLLDILEASQKSQPPANPDVDVSKWSELGAWGQIMRVIKLLTAAGVIAALFSLVVACEASQVSRDALRATAVSSGTTALLQFDNMLAQQDQNGRLLARFMTGDQSRKLAQTKADAKFTEVAIAQLDLLDGYRSIVELEGLTDYFDQEAFWRWYDWTFRESPDLCRVLDTVQETYADDFVEPAVEPCRGKLTLRSGP